MGRGDPKSGTSWPGQINGNSRPGWDVLVRDGGPGVGLAGHLLLTHEPFHPLNLLDLLLYNIKYFKVPKIAYWLVDYKSLPKKRNCILGFGAKIPGTTSLALWYSQLHSNTVQNSTRAFGLLPSAAEATISHQWWPGCHWYRSVSYTSTGRWPLVTIDTNSNRCW